MRLTDLLRELHQRDIRLYVEEGQLRCKAPQNALSAELRSAITTHNKEIRELLAPKSRKLPRIKPVAHTGPLPLSFAQQRLWFLDQLSPGNCDYNIPVALRLTGNLDVEALERSFDELLRRHDILRTVYGFVNDLPVQHIAPNLKLSLQKLHLKDLEAESCDQAVLRIACEEGQKPFDLTTGPMLRAHLLVLPPHMGNPQHVLLIVFHHIVTDDWSSALFFRELAALYAAFAAGKPTPLAPPLFQYADFAVAQREWLQGEIVEEHLSYWRAKLARHVPALDLPTRPTRLPAKPGHAGETSFEIPIDVHEKLRRLGQEFGVSQFVILLSSFFTLLYRYTGQQDLSVGTPIANRNWLDTEGLMGFFVNTLILRADLSGNPRFVDFLAKVQTIVSEAQAHQDLPFERLVETLRPQAKDANLFHVMMVFHNLGFEELAVPGMEVRAVGGIKRHAIFELVLHITEDGKGLRGWFEYDTAAFEERAILRMAQHFCTLIESVARGPHTRLSELPIISTAENQKLLAAWNAVNTVRPQERHLHELFESQVVHRPDAVAVAFQGEQISYSELNSRANQLAHLLRERGVRPESRAGLFIERCIDMLVGILGILKAGSAYVPIDPTYPTERTAQVLFDSGVEILLTRAGLLPRLPDIGIETLCFDRDRTSIAAQSAHNPNIESHPDSAAYVIYTSGSTGAPKGVLISHANAVHSTRARTAYYPERLNGFLLLSSFAFDSSIAGIFWTLSEGGILCLPEEGAELDPRRLVELIREHKLSHLLCLPSLYGLLLNQFQIETPDSLRVVIVAGEACAPEIAARHHRQLSGASLYNEYGPTETSVWATVYRIRAEDGDSNIPIGRPITNTSLYILGQNFEPVPIGTPGEIYIGGRGVGRGFLSRPDFTAERFIPDQFGTGGERLYRTGDLGRHREDGNIEFLGRIDHQVKIRGYRIELGEIEVALYRNPHVREAVIVAHEDERKERRLVAYVVETESGSFAPPELRAFLRESLPEYMVPSAIVILEALPLTANGKVDRKALPAPDFGGQSTPSYVAHRTQTEELLCELWAEVLGVARVGVQDDFFELGGHSLLATQVISRIRRSFDIDLPLRSLFERTNIAALAPLVEEARSGGEAHKAPPLIAAPRTGALPLSFAQQRLWFLDQLEPGSSFYCVPVALRLRGELNVEALEAGLRGLAQRHEILRTTFPAQGGQPIQRIAPQLDAPLQRVDLRGLELEVREAEMRRLIEEEAKRPFDLARGPLARATLIELGDNDHALALMLHHIVSDGWSIDILIRDFAALYTAFSRGQAPDLPPLPVQYADFSRWQRSWLQGEALDVQMSYWRRQLEGAPPALELPTDHPRPAIQTYRGATLAFEAPNAVTQQLHALARSAGATLFMVLLAAFKVLLMRYSGQRDLCVGSPIANRTRLETEGLIGFFVNTLVLRTDLSGNPTFSALLARVRETALDAQAHQDLPFEKLVEELQPLRDPSRSPLFQAMFVFQNAPLRALDLPGLHIESVEPDTQTAKFDLMLTMQEKDNALKGEWEYNTDLFNAETAARLMRHYQTLLEGVAANPESRLSELPLLGDDERRQILVEWNATAVDYPKDRCIHELFEEQAARTPGAIALIFAETRLTYDELDRKANQLAHRLRNEGVGPETIVGICMERSLEMVVGLLGVLKAGGAYLPLDPDYPFERLAYMIGDASPRLILTQERLAKRLPVDTPILRLDVDWPQIETHSANPPPHSAKPQNLAYVIYTSGSTGNPKGVAALHKGVVRLVKHTNYVRFDNDKETVLQFAPLAFDASTFEIWGPLLNGARLLMAPAGAFLALDELGRVVKKHGITTLWLTAALFERVVDHDLEDFAGVKQLLTGGDIVSPSHARTFREACPLSVLINGYGPTENTTFSTSHVVSALCDQGSLPIGRPISNSQAHILDAQLNLVPIGAVGELYLEGAGLARGYLNRPDLTAEKFVPSPFAAASGERIYRTGDLARRRSDGTIDFLGRVDQQVKIRGFRIEINEVEAALATVPRVRQAVVISRKDLSGEKSLTAYFVCEPREIVEIETVRECLAQKLPAYMIPASLHRLDELPLTNNGKVDP